MNIKIDDLIFDRGHYDADGDVLYLARGNTSAASDATETPEGHAVRYDENGEVIGITIVNAKWLVKHDGCVTITVPHPVRLGAEELASALG